jgi:aspartate racemase
MLAPIIDSAKIQDELKGCLNLLRQSGSSVLAIACNTLHAFLDENEQIDDLVLLPNEVVSAVPSHERPLVLCTSTSAKFGVHKQFFPCVYPNESTQQEVDEIIEQILKGEDEKSILQKMNCVIERQPDKTIVLGCTELSLLTADLRVPNKLIIDPLDLVADKVVERVFQNEKNLFE